MGAGAPDCGIGRETEVPAPSSVAPLLHRSSPAGSGAVLLTLTAHRWVVDHVTSEDDDLLRLGGACPEEPIKLLTGEIDD
jgi:hypothetical protein